MYLMFSLPRLPLVRLAFGGERESVEEGDEELLGLVQRARAAGRSQPGRQLVNTLIYHLLRTPASISI